MEEKKEVFCKDCKYCRPDRSWWWFCLALPLAPFFAYGAYRNQYRYAKCGAVQRRFSDYRDEFLIAGRRKKDKPDYMYCSIERSELGDCGPAGTLFVPKKELPDEISPKLRVVK